jgi:hypothetical protein
MWLKRTPKNATKVAAQFNNLNFSTKPLLMASYCHVTSKCWNSEVVAAWQQKGRRISMDINSQQYLAITMIWHSKQCAILEWTVISIGDAL